MYCSCYKYITSLCLRLTALSFHLDWPSMHVCGRTYTNLNTHTHTHTLSLHQRDFTLGTFLLIWLTAWNKGPWKNIWASDKYVPLAAAVWRRQILWARERGRGRGRESQCVCWVISSATQRPARLLPLSRFLRECVWVCECVSLPDTWHHTALSWQASRISSRMDKAIYQQLIWSGSDLQ